MAWVGKDHQVPIPLPVQNFKLFPNLSLMFFKMDNTCSDIIVRDFTTSLEENEIPLEWSHAK